MTGSAVTSATAVSQSAELINPRATLNKVGREAASVTLSEMVLPGQDTWSVYEPEPAGVHSPGMVTPLAARGVSVTPQPAPALPALMAKELRHLAKGLALHAPPPVENRSTLKRPTRSAHRTFKPLVAPPLGS